MPFLEPGQDNHATGSARDDLRPGEASIALPETFDAGLFFIGRIETPWSMPDQCPRRGDFDGPGCLIVLDPRWAAALEGIEGHAFMQVLYWMDRARRDLIRQRPRSTEQSIGTFAIRSPVRPNPIASSTVRLLERRDHSLLVRGLGTWDGGRRTSSGGVVVVVTAADEPEEARCGENGDPSLHGR